MVKLVNLQKLDLSRNKIYGLPDFIVELQNIEELILNECSFMGNCPKEIAALSKLLKPALSTNLLNKVPDSHKSLTQLKGLNLNVSLFREFPVVVTNITSLERLYIGWNKLTSIPESLGKLSNLRALTLVSPSHYFVSGTHRDIRKASDFENAWQQRHAHSGTNLSTWQS